MIENTPRCKFCVHWVKHQTQLGIGVCFALPPTPVIVNQQGQIGQTNIRPLTTGDEGCGMFHSHPQAANEGDETKALALS